MVAPSPVDAFGRSIIEAMSQKTLTLANKKFGHSEIIVDKETGFFYNYLEENNLINTLSYIYKNYSHQIITRIPGNAYDYFLI